MKTPSQVHARRRFRLDPLLGLAALAAAPLAVRAGTADTFATGGSLLTASNYTSGNLPANTTDVSLTTATTALTITAGALTAESLFQNSTTVYTLSNGTATATNSTLTLGNAGGFTNANNNVANDLLAISGTAGTFTIAGANSGGGTGTLGIVLASSGNFDVSGGKAAVISANISETGGARTLTVSGVTSKTVTLSGINSFTGGLVVTGTETDVLADAGLGAAGGSVTINGGRLGITPATGAAPLVVIDPTRSFFLGANPTGGNKTGTLSVGTGFTAVYNGALQTLAGAATGDLAKQGGGTLQLGGVSTYNGGTFVNNATVQLAGGANRLPTATTVTVGQAASTNLGTLDLNGNNQQIAGLNSAAGTGTSTAATNVVTSASGAATLTINTASGGSFVFSAGTAANSGVLSGGLSLVKAGAGTQTLGGVNTYTGGTTVSAGTLVIAATGSINGSTQVSVTTGGALTLNNAASLADTGTLTLTGASSTGTALNLNGAAGSVETIGSLILDGTVEPAGPYTAQSLALLDPNVTFTSANGETLLVAAVPEPATVLGGLLLIGAAGWSQRRRLRGGLA